MKLDRVNAFAGVTSKVMLEEQKLASEVAQLEYQYSQELAKQEEPLPELIEEYITQWRANSNRHNELVDSIKNNLPNYYNLKFNRSTTEINQLQSSFLSNDQSMAWVSYYVGETNSYAIAVTHDQKYFLKLDSSDKIIRLLKSFNNYVSQQMKDEFKKTSFDVYQLLFRSIDSCLAKQSKKIKKIVIIPDGPLNYLNFELLGKPTHKSWHYTLYDYQFSYGYSSTLLWAEFSDQRKWDANTINMVGFAPEFVSNAGQEINESTREGSEKPGYDSFDFSPLQKNQEEVVKVAEILNRKKVKTSVFLGPQADEASFKKANLGSYNIIHLATHGFVSKEGQNVAGIAFAKKQDSSDDGILYMDEIFSLKNKANLVCLSACETGSGVYQQGEGLVGLTRAFIYSGAQNLVVSLWKVQDESTAQLMTHFYSALVKNHSVSQSLREAKVAMTKKNPELPPYYWSAFIHVGLN
jgi:CHAT domain-containing protein